MTKVSIEALRNHQENLKITVYLRVAAWLVVPEVMMIAHPALKTDQRRRLGSTRDTKYRSRSNSILSQGATCDADTESSRSEAPLKTFMLRRKSSNGG